MEVRIQSIHFDASEQLQSFVQKKVAEITWEQVRTIAQDLSLIHI